MITVYVDGRAVKVPPTFTIRHAIMRWDQATFEALQDGACYVADASGREVDVEGAVFDGMHLQILEAK
jgi:hypothetical protein